MFYRLYLTSRNRKLGPIPAAYIDRSGCPFSCRLLENGCYAEHGPTRRIWNNVANGGVDLDEFCRQVAELIGLRRLWRYGVAGDLPGEGDLIDPLQLDRLVQANRKRPVLCYTHKPVLQHPFALANRAAIADAIGRGFLINLSADGPAQADLMAELGIAPVVTVLPVVYGRRKRKSGGWAETIGEYRDRIEPLPTHTPKGRRIAICPATYSRTTCDECRACARPREAVIGFPAHRRRRQRMRISPPATSPPAGPGASRNTGTWPRSSPTKPRRTQPEASHPRQQQLAGVFSFEVALTPGPRSEWPQKSGEQSFADAPANGDGAPLVAGWLGADASRSSRPKHENAAFRISDFARGMLV